MILNPKPFYFVRHGETDWNLKNIAMGQIDVELNQKGINQAHAIAKTIKNEPFELIAASSLNRARKTAEIISNYTSRPIRFFDKLKEICWGLKEGASQDGWLDKWREGQIIEGGESFDDFTERVRQGLEDIFHLPAPVLIVSHGGVYMALQKILELPFIDLKNCDALFHRPPEYSTHPWFVCSIDEGED